MTRPDPLSDEMRRRRDVALDRARSLLGRPKQSNALLAVGEDVELFASMRAALECDQYVALVERVANEAVPA